MEEEIKTFKDLTREVVERGICGKCGGCVSFRSAGELNALEMRKNEVPRYINEDYCLKCEICYLICPQTDTLNVELQEKFGWKPPIGGYLKITSAQTTDKKIKGICADGGVVTSLLLYLLERRIQKKKMLAKIVPFTERKKMRAEESLSELAGGEGIGGKA